MSSLFDLSKLTQEEILALKQFSLFPPQPLPFEYAQKWFEQENSDILNDLSNKGWLIKTEAGFYMHHVISDVVKYENKPSYKECYGLVDMMGDDLNFDVTEIFTTRLPILPFGEKVAKHFGGIEDENIADLIHNTGYIYKYLGEYDRALEFYGKALEIQEKILGKEHPDTATTYNNMAIVYDNQGEYDKALELYGQALEIKEKILGKEHRLTATTYNNMAIVYKNQGEYNRALELYGKVLEISEKILGKKHRLTATTYNNMAVVYEKQGEYDRALEFYGKALAIDEKILGKEHPSTAMTYNNIALVYYNQDKYDLALGLYLKSYKIFISKLSENHHYTKNTYIGLKKTYLKKHPTQTPADFERWLEEQMSADNLVMI
ncbi:MAG: tetratricopeptide repeat protein [Oscillospiraceae bacterium]|nr:tetratricopeptide repeat protein [Oscillospiraceae bacterium]